MVFCRYSLFCTPILAFWETAKCHYVFSANIIISVKCFQISHVTKTNSTALFLPPPPKKCSQNILKEIGKFYDSIYFLPVMRDGIVLCCCCFFLKPQSRAYILLHNEDILRQERGILRQISSFFFFFF